MGKFRKATKAQAKLRLGLVGPAGSGKTWTALELGSLIGKRVAVIDTERGSASKYSDTFSFDSLELETFSPLTYVDAIHAAEAEGYDVIVVDSLSHAWMGKEGALDQVDRRAGGKLGSFGAWRDVTPMHNALVDALVGAKAHIIVTLRAKTEYVLETNDKGKPAPRKVGMAPVQREGLDYEFDVVGTLDHTNAITIDKTRCARLHGRVFQRENPALAELLRAWLTDGAAPAEEPGRAPAKAAPPAPPSGQITPNQSVALHAALHELKVGHAEADRRKLVGKARQEYLRATCLLWCSQVVGREITTSKELTSAEASRVIDEAKACIDSIKNPEAA
jgi:hypothetical protein